MNRAFQDILDSFAGKIDYVRKASMGVPKTFTINLAIVETDRVYDLSGNLFYVWSAPDDISYIEIKVNKSSEPAIPYYFHTGLRTPFEKLLITTPAGQTGNVVILYGTEAPELLELIDNRSAAVAGIEGILAELRGDVTPENWGTQITVGNAAAVQILAANANRKSCWIQAKKANGTNLVYIGFDNTVTTTKWIAELQAGMTFSIDDYRGALFARANAIGQLVGYGEV